MIKIFNHYIHRRTLLQIMLDFGLIIGIVVLSVGWHTPDLTLAASAALPSAALLGAAALAINAALGFYQRVHNRSIAQSRARAVLSLVLLLPLAYVTLRVLPLGLDRRDYVALSIAGGLAFMLAHRVYVGSGPASSTSGGKLEDLPNGTQRLTLPLNALGWATNIAGSLSVPAAVKNAFQSNPGAALAKSARCHLL